MYEYYISAILITLLAGSVVTIGMYAIYYLMGKCCRQSGLKRLVKYLTVIILWLALVIGCGVLFIACESSGTLHRHNRRPQQVHLVAERDYESVHGVSTIPNMVSLRNPRIISGKSVAAHTRPNPDGLDFFRRNAVLVSFAVGFGPIIIGGLVVLLSLWSVNISERKRKKKAQMLKEKGERTEPTNQPADHTGKVYCKDCNHYYCGVWISGGFYDDCRKIVGYTDTPTCLRPVYLDCKVSNKSNNCSHYEPKPEPVRQSKKSIWKKLFGK